MLPLRISYEKGIGMLEHFFFYRKDNIIRFICLSILIFSLSALSSANAENPENQKDFYFIHPHYPKVKPKVIAVLPMDNFSLEPLVEKAMEKAVYERLIAKGYLRTNPDTVRTAMKEFGIQTPGQLAGISPAKLKEKLKCDALLMGQIEQSGTIHAGVYDAVVASCSLRLVDAASGDVLWRTEQWRSAHRQWQLDPLNAFLNIVGHEGDSLEGRVTWLVQEMLKTLPEGAIRVEEGDLLNQAKVIKADVTP
jgi:hypothetical protein